MIQCAALFFFCVTFFHSASAIESYKFPLFTRQSYIVDSNGQVVRWNCVNWSGAAQKDGVVGGLDHSYRGDIAKLIASWGFNCVRLPFSLWMVQSNPLIKTSLISANLDLNASRQALSIFDAVIDSLVAENLMVILDNHMSKGDWCCNNGDGNGLWYTDDYPESVWISIWQEIVARYKHIPQVVGAELRNEPRCAHVTVNNESQYLCAKWGGGNNNSVNL